MVSLSILRRIEARAASGAIQGVKISLHPELADALQNHYRQELAGIEEELDVKIEIIATAGMHRPDERIEWQKREKPARVTKQPKPTPVILQAWDLALPEDEEEDDLLDAVPAKAQTRTTRDAGEPAAVGDDAAARKRKRRRGGRKRKKKGPGENGAEGAGENGAESGGENAGENGSIVLEHDDSEAFAIAFGREPRAVITRPAESAERFDSDSDGDGDDEGPDDDFDDGPEDGAEGTEGIEGAPGVPKKRRRRRRRRKA
jgi:ribonuclease E